MKTKKELFIEIFNIELYNALNKTHQESYGKNFEDSLKFEWDRNGYYFGNGGDEWVMFNINNGALTSNIYWGLADKYHTPKLEIFKKFALEHKYRFFRLSIDDLYNGGIKFSNFEDIKLAFSKVVENI